MGDRESQKNTEGTALGRSFLYQECRLCPRNCGVNRLAGEVGYCGETADVKVARAALHFWEEPCISGYDDLGTCGEDELGTRGEEVKGSGAIFFSGCNLRCVYCQNHEIAAGHHGKIVTVRRLAEMMLELKAQGALNLNLVTGVHFVPTILDAIDLAREAGFDLPVVYNTSGYESIETLRMLRGYVDIYLPDLKYCDSARAEEYSHAKDYFEKATAAIDEMADQVGTPVFRTVKRSEPGQTDTGRESDAEKSAEENEEKNAEAGLRILQRGVVVRHLVLPGATLDAKKILSYLHEKYNDRIYVSILNQYTPIEAYLKNYPKLNRHVTRREYDKVVDHAIGIGMEQVFIQDEQAASESFIPAFDTTGV